MNDDLADDPRATPIKCQASMDFTVVCGRRMLWQFWYSDGSARCTYDSRQGMRLKRRMMLAGLEIEHGIAK